jgi:hypothetical protein
MQTGKAAAFFHLLRRKATAFEIHGATPIGERHFMGDEKVLAVSAVCFQVRHGGDSCLLDRNGITRL